MVELVEVGAMARRARASSEAPRHAHRNKIESVELPMQHNVIPYCDRIIDTPAMLALAWGDDTSGDPGTKRSTISNPNKALASASDVCHVSLYTNNEHLAKVGRVQAACSQRPPRQRVTERQPSPAMLGKH